jgi:hypothetical protein
MTGESAATILLIKMYATLMVGQKQRGLAAKETPLSPGAADEETLPIDIPSLMLGYLDELNRNVGEGRRPDPDIHRDAEAVAWACLRTTYIPAEIARADAAKELRGADADNRLDYLELKLHLILRVGPDRDRIRFVLHPLAEHLAGLHLVRTYGSNVMLWTRFLDAVKKRPGPPESIRGFLLAVRESCLSTTKVPALVAESLGQMVGLPDDVLKQAGARQQVQHLMASLAANGQAQAARTLGLIGIDPKVAVPALVRALDTEDSTLRDYAYSALDSLCSDARMVASTLLEAVTPGNGSPRSKASDVLQRLGPLAVPYLIDKLSDANEVVRRFAAETLGTLGSSARLAVPSLAGALNDPSATVRLQVDQSLKQIQEDNLN